jgi:enterochelin esterase family protein
MAGLSMGSLQTSISGLTHPELFSSLGIFSGFIHDWIQGSEIDMVKRGSSDDLHMALLQNPTKFNQEFELFFRAIGDKDPFLDYFHCDDEICEKAGIRQVRKIYSGGHDWNVWRQCIRDFSMLVFQN